MIKVSKLTDYAVVTLSALARSDDPLMTASGLSVKTGLPEPTVAKVLKLLAREQILQSNRGVNGGYKLSAKMEDISVARVIRAIDGPIFLTACVDGNSEGCSFEGSCATKGRWNGVNRAVLDALEGVSLADMISSNFLPRVSGDLKSPALAGEETAAE